MARRASEEDGGDEHAIVVHLDEMLRLRSMTLTELADRVGVTVVNLSVLDGEPGDILGLDL